MLFEDRKKEDIIKQLNSNYRTILTYGDDGLVPVGQFVVIDIQENDISADCADEVSKFDAAKIILSKIDDENVQITLPMTVFLTKYADVAKINADTFSISTDTAKSIEDIEDEAEFMMLFDETMRKVRSAETISLEESEADYIINGESQSLNYSICPVDLGIYRERVREISYQKQESGYER